MTDVYGAQVRAQLVAVQAELAELHAGEEPYEDERLVPTPGQWIWLWNRDTPQERLERAERAVANWEVAHRARFREVLHREHFGDLLAWKVRAEQAEARIAAVRALHRPVEHLSLMICDECSTERSTGPGRYERHVVMPWPCPTITALDGPMGQSVVERNAATVQARIQRALAGSKVVPDIDTPRLLALVLGTRRPTSLDLALIGEACGVSVDWLLGDG